MAFHPAQKVCGVIEVHTGQGAPAGTANGQLHAGTPFLRTNSRQREPKTLLDQGGQGLAAPGCFPLRLLEQGIIQTNRGPLHMSKHITLDSDMSSQQDHTHADVVPPLNQPDPAAATGAFAPVGAPNRGIFTRYETPI